MTLHRLEKKKFANFLLHLGKEYEVIAPVKKDVVRFLPIKDASEIHFEKNSFFPVKEYFFKNHQTLFQFDGKKIQVSIPQTPKRAFFGLRRCDLNAILHQDIAFGEVNDPYYQSARENTLLLGYHCNSAPSPYCFCGSLKLEEFFDLMFFDRGEHFIVEIGSKKGEALIASNPKFFESTTEPKPDTKIPGSERLEVKDISQFYNHPDWKKGTDLCLSCGACTNLCPTCYCFDIKDEVLTANPDAGKRTRQWSSCQIPEFTKVAGEHVFRKDREQRFKHRIYHQLDYFKQKHGVNLCVGCGRCIEACPTRIDFVQIINDMSHGK